VLEAEEAEQLAIKLLGTGEITDAEHQVIDADDAGHGNFSFERNLLPSSLPGLTPQVGLARLAAPNTAELGQVRVPVQSIVFAEVLRRRWTRGASPRVTS